MLKYRRAFCGFSVNDLDKAREFYGSTLGLQVKDNSMGVLELYVEGGTLLIIYPKPDHIPASFTVLNFQVVDLEKTVDDLIGQGILFEQYEGDIKTDSKGICRGTEGPDMAWFKDPAGNILSVLEIS